MNSRRHRSPRPDGRKCVQLVGQDIPVRLSNEDAHRIADMFGDHDGQYCPKSVFKKYRIEHPEHPALHRIDSQNKIVADDRPTHR